MTIIRRRPAYVWIVERMVGPLPEGVVFTYGSRTYVPSGNALPGDLLAHEREHTRQQGRFPWAWWLRYLVDRRFRFDQELAAYRVQMRYLRSYGRPSAYAVEHMARSLSGAMYGHLVDVEAARAAIGAA